MDNFDSTKNDENTNSCNEYDERNSVTEVNDNSGTGYNIFDDSIPEIIKSNHLLKEIWDKEFPVIFSGYERFSDVPKKEMTPFTSYISILRDQREAVETIGREGMYYESVENGKVLKKVHPAHKVAADSARMLIPYYMRYGLTEYDRKTNEKRFPAKDDGDDDFKDIGL